MMKVALLCCVLLSPVAAFPRNALDGALNLQPSFPESGPPSNILSSQVTLLDAKSCQYLLRKAPSLAPLPEYLSNLALRVALEEIGCPNEAHILQLQQFRMKGKDSTESLLYEIQKLKEEGIDDAELILRHVEESPGKLGRVQRSINIPEACAHDPERMLYDTAVLFVELTEKLPATELVTELKTSAIKVTQNCTYEAWKHVEAGARQLMKSAEIKDLTLPIEDKMYFLVRITALWKRFLLYLLQKLFQTYHSKGLGFLVSLRCPLCIALGIDGS